MKKDKKIEVQVSDAKVTINDVKVDGYQLTIGKKLIGEIAEFDDRFGVLKNGKVDGFHKSIEQAVESLLATYNLNH